MASYVKFQSFVEHLAEKVHNLGSDTLKVYLSNTAPNVATHTVKADIAEIATGNGYAGPITLSVTSSTQSSGTYSLVVSDPTAVTASGGSIGPFRYLIFYNDTPTSPADPLISYWDYGTSTTLLNGESLNIDAGASLLTLA